MFPESRLRPHPTCFHPSTLRLPGPQLTRPSCLFQMVKLYLCTDFCPLGGVAGANQSCGRAQEMECPWKRLAKSNPPEEQSGYSHVHRRKSYYPACRFFFPLSQAECTLNQLDFFHKVKDAITRSHSAGSKSLFLFSLEL